MPLRPNFLPVETAKGWMVSVPPGMSADGKRRRKFFPEWKAANAFAGTMRKEHATGARGSVLSATLAGQAVRAQAMLAEVGISLVEAARMAVEALRNDDARETFKERHHRATLDGERWWSPRYARDMEKLPRWLGVKGTAMRCGELRPEVVDKLLRAQGAKAQATLEMRRARVLAVINYKPKTRKVREVAILTVGQCAALLRACDTREQRWAVALLLFAGIRPDAEDGEIRRLDWSAVGAAEIYVSGQVAKTNTDRHVPVLPRLQRLLRGHPASGPVVPPNWARCWKRIRKAAEIGDLQDAARHTFASHLLAWHGGEEGPVKMAMGHSLRSTVLFSAYRRAVTVAAGRKFFR